ncbi:hypothetical protein CC86DRAFT_67666 [Ophiobolus disseminans]|uniref:Uncharacterized protein n=1 Tax=Ophiobolus disseminans TaxID=1469910 RepID=A0A6A6ZSY2_9PLEO|nr:hypothetical protein CC86DRAFT_67666 [Ophiobolus disseminans]
MDSVSHAILNFRDGMITIGEHILMCYSLTAHNNGLTMKLHITSFTMFPRAYILHPSILSQVSQPHHNSHLQFASTSHRIITQTQTLPSTIANVTMQQILTEKPASKPTHDMTDEDLQAAIFFTGLFILIIICIAAALLGAMRVDKRTRAQDREAHLELGESIVSGINLPPPAFKEVSNAPPGYVRAANEPTLVVFKVVFVTTPELGDDG